MLDQQAVECLVAGSSFEIVASRVLDEESGDPWLVARKTASAAAQT